MLSNNTVIIDMIGYDFCKDDYEKLFNRVFGSIKNTKSPDKLVIYYSSNGGETQYVVPTRDLIFKLISHFKLEKRDCIIVALDNIYSSGAFLLTELCLKMTVKAEVPFAVVFHKPVSNDCRNSLALQALDTLYQHYVNMLNNLHIYEGIKQDEISVPINRFNIHLANQSSNYDFDDRVSDCGRIK